MDYDQGESPTDPIIRPVAPDRPPVPLDPALRPLARPALLTAFLDQEIAVESERLHAFLPPYEAAWHTLADKKGKPLHNAFNNLALAYRQEVDVACWQARDVIDAHEALGANQRELVRAVWRTTLGWSGSEEHVAISKAIPLSDFVDGWRDTDGQLDRDRRGVPLFLGTGLHRETVVNGLKSLVKEGRLARLEWREGKSPKVAYRIECDWPALLVAIRTWRQHVGKFAMKRFAARAIMTNSVTLEMLRALDERVADDEDYL